MKAKEEDITGSGKLRKNITATRLAGGGSALKRNGPDHLVKPIYLNMELKRLRQSQSSAE